MDKLNNLPFRASNSITIKLLTVGFLIFVCLVPSPFVFVLIRERSGRREEVRREITEKWGSDQLVAGPVLSIPYRKDELGNMGTVYLLPKKLTYRTSIEPEVRSRGIFDSVVYTAKVNGIGSFQMPDTAAINTDEAFLSVEITDTRGVGQDMELNWDGKMISFQPGAKNPIIGKNGIHAGVPFADRGKEYNFSFEFNIRGNEKIEFLPLGNETRVEAQSNWKNPSFIGAYLPEERNVDEGFSAAWSVSSLGRSYPQKWITGEVDQQTILASRFGVSLLQGVDVYTKTTRTVKYAIMFIAVTFMAFFLFEVLSKVRIHPFQYLLIGFALALFYLLLLSLSERFGFLPAYAISTFATIGLITGYSVKVLRAHKKALIVSGLLTLLYSYLYVIVQLEDLALLYGSILLFALLALTMYLTRNINWYRIDAGEQK